MFGSGFYREASFPKQYDGARVSHESAVLGAQDMPVTFQFPQNDADVVVTMYATGKLTSREYDEFLPLVEKTFKARDKVRFLLILDRFKGWEAGALWKDLMFDIRHFNDVERIAVVGETEWERWGTKIFKPFTAAEVRYFDLSKAVEAERWVRADSKADG